ncbi:MAG: PDZ domain-containing protein [Planctomycetia bacterium]|nr:PDZ domain-containing protein [Planctomycetia bacterium]
MKNLNVSLFLVFCLMFLESLCVTANEQTLHLILAGDYRRNDKRNQNETNLDINNIRNFFKANIPNHNLEIYEMDGKMLTPQIIRRIISSLNLQNEDCIVFYFSGHEINFSEKNQYLQLKDYNGHLAAMSRSELRRLLLETNAQFIVLFTEFGSAFARKSPQNSVISPTLPSAIIQQLFFDSFGCLDLSSSKPGHSSYATNNGSIATLALLQNLKETNLDLQNDSSQKIDWSTIIPRTTTQMKELSEEEEQKSQSLYVYQIPGKPRLGARVQSLGNGNVVVNEIIPDSPAQKSGLALNDIILEVNGTEIFNEEAFSTAVDETSGKMQLKIKRTSSNGSSNQLLIEVQFDDNTKDDLALENNLSLPADTSLSLGVLFQENSSTIAKIIRGKAAMKNNFRVGDQILNINGIEVFDEQSCAEALKNVGNELTIAFLRDNEDNIKIIKSSDLERVQYSNRSTARSQSLTSGAGNVRAPNLAGISKKRYTFGAKLKGNTIIEVFPDSPAEKAGLEVNDQITQINGNEIRTSDDFSTAIDQSGPRANIIVQKFRTRKPDRIFVQLNNKGFD